MAKCIYYIEVLKKVVKLVEDCSFKFDDGNKKVCVSSLLISKIQDLDEKEGLRVAKALDKQEKEFLDWYDKEKEDLEIRK